MPPNGADCGDAAWVAEAREALAAHDARLTQGFDAGQHIDRLLAARANAVDGWVRKAWARCIPGDAALALFAVGGYGRGELFPHSDIDLLVIGASGVQTEHADALSRMLALLWDLGLPVGHAVRSFEECTQAASDVTVLTALLEARPLLANLAEVRALMDAIGVDKVWPAAEFFQAKRRELEMRHARFGDTADNLEPNIKDGPGGLRDVQNLRWMARRVLGVYGTEELIALGQLGVDEHATLERERRTLSRLRFGLHLVAGKAEERLRFDHQKTLAARLHHVDEADNPLVEKMMQEFYRSASVVQRISERMLQRFEEQIEGEGEVVPIDAEFATRRGYLVARDDVWPGGDLARVFDLFAVWADHASLRGLHSQTARALAESLHALPAWRQAPMALREQFMALLRGPVPVRTLERMARLGVLGVWIPEFANVTGRMQFDLFHVYTVDQHTLAVLRNMASFASEAPDERFAAAHEVWPQLRKPELLLLAGLFHDIAKGRGGDHSELGAVDAREFCEGHGLGESDTALVEWLVRRHLLMSTSAQKLDISDPAVIHKFATEVADRERLDYLYLLTCADIAGTSPKLWNAWKDRLLTDLRSATRLALRRGLEHPVAAVERIAESRDRARGLLSAHGVGDAEADALFARIPQDSFLRGRADQVVWQALALRDTAPDAVVVDARRLRAGAQALEVFVHAPDRDGLFSGIVITLDRLGLVIQQARALDGPGGTIFDLFQVLPADPRQALELEAIERKVAEVLTQRLDPRPARRAQPRHLRHFRVPPRIEFNASADGRHTVFSLVCTDRPGLLADVAHVLRERGVRVHDARVATFGERVEDVFRLSAGDGTLLDEAAQAALREALLASIDGDVAR
ncbi:[protein-PII] uridylyltransferase [Lysobacteraceae bacterium NML93-0792]|nr:[protein-PII] uridylyltransferase [Xanthomonadaceae bacterium NML93-0792]PBS16669.1 [protein-PII] uridylyltransferase [Xanthomonadaceae bacterium NML93-0793]PBS20242.1 [protein-PII] uridylyltransferase [Xanthomonadaceae bacterium NML93-0831]